MRARLPVQQAIDWRICPATELHQMRRMRNPYPHLHLNCLWWWKRCTLEISHWEWFWFEIHFYFILLLRSCCMAFWLACMNKMCSPFWHVFWEAHRQLNRCSDGQRGGVATRWIRRLPQTPPVAECWHWATLKCSEELSGSFRMQLHTTQ